MVTVALVLAAVLVLAVLVAVAAHAASSPFWWLYYCWSGTFGMLGKVLVLTVSALAETVAGE